MSFSDLRTYIDWLEENDDLEVVRGADWNLEIGGLTEISVRDNPEPPAIIFDDIKGYKTGQRILINFLRTPKRWSAVSGFEPTDSKREAILLERQHSLADLDLIPPVEVDSGPILENVLSDDEVDVLGFPVPKWHDHDGGRFIGTADMVITDDAETGRVNFGTYRVQVHGQNEVTAHISPGKDGRLNLRSYLGEGEPCPIAITVGQPPDLYMASPKRLPSSMSEYEYVGGLRGSPVEVIPGEVTGLPIPNNAEIVLEGHIYPDSEPISEGPFGEWTGYYAGGSVGEEDHEVLPITVERIYHRNDPIIMGAPPLRLPASKGNEIKNAAIIWDEIASSGIPGIGEVNVMPFALGWFVVVSIDQQYGGHATQVGHQVSTGTTAGYHGRFVAVVDVDVDVFDEDEVFWAICSRCDPAEDIAIIENCWSSPLDPTIPPEKKLDGDFTNSRAIFDATRPYHWRDRFPEVNELDAEYANELREKWNGNLPFVGEPS